METTQGNQGTTIEEFRTNGNNLQADMQAQINQMRVQAEEFRASGNQLQAEMQAQVNQMRAQLLEVTGSIDLLNRNMANVHGKIDMGLIASQNNLNRDLMESKIGNWFANIWWGRKGIIQRMVIQIGMCNGEVKTRQQRCFTEH